MATKKRKSTKRRTAARRKKAEQRLPAGLGTLFGGLLLMVLAFVQGDSVWRVLHDVLFGLFGCGSFVLGAAVCCLAVLYTRGEELLSRILKLVLGLIFVCGTVIVFSDIQPQGLSALQMLSACYANGVNAWLSGGAIGFVLGGVLLTALISVFVMTLSCALGWVVAKIHSKLKRKNLDFIVLNSLQDKGAGFRTDTNKVTILDAEGKTEFPLKSKREVAADIVNRICTLLS